MIWVIKMDKGKELPQRKNPRLVNYDYGSAGAYFITICTQNRRCVLSRIVGRGLAPAEASVFTENLQAQKYRQRDCFSLPICVIMIWVIKMDKGKELPQRKNPRLVNYDYGSAGAYFITICTQNRRCVLSRIVGRGLAPAEASGL